MKGERMKCGICQDEGWLCEKHPDKPFPHNYGNGFSLVECSGPGTPCKCNKEDPPWNFGRKDSR